MKNRNAVSSDHHHREDAELDERAACSGHPGCPICAVLRGGPSIGPNSSLLECRRSSAGCPGFRTAHGLAPMSATTNGGRLLIGTSGSADRTADRPLAATFGRSCG